MATKAKKVRNPDHIKAAQAVAEWRLIAKVRGQIAKRKTTTFNELVRKRDAMIKALEKLGEQVDAVGSSASESLQSAQSAENDLRDALIEFRDTPEYIEED
jgi:hypothetical protein